jgi:hypothetical protein
VGGEGCQDFALLAFRDLDEVQGASEFRCDLIEFCGRDPEVPMGLLKAERRRAGLGGRELGPPEALQTHSVRRRVTVGRGVNPYGAMAAHASIRNHHQNARWPPSRDREQLAASVAAVSETAGMPAFGVASPAGLRDFLRRQAKQILEAARLCEFPDERAELEEVARDCILKAEAIDGEQ